MSIKNLHHYQSEFQLLPDLEKHDRVDLGLTRSNLEIMPNVSNASGVDIFIKRDDCLPLAMGGNKARQLEYYLGPALKMGADTVLITGAIQSNFVRLCAAACRKLNLKPVVQLERRVPKDDKFYNTSGNVLLNELLGAEVYYFDEGEDEAAADKNLDTIADTLRAQGSKPYVIHLSTDYPPLGGLGYALAACETHLQCQEQKLKPDHIIVPTGSGLTHAGFLCGMRAIGWDAPVHGICVRRNAEPQTKRISKRAAEIDELLGKPNTTHANDINIYDDVLAPGYGQMNSFVANAIKLVAQSEGILLDPVYSGRTFAGFLQLIEAGVIQKGETIIFLHTGGMPALFAYHNDLTAIL